MAQTARGCFKIGCLGCGGTVGVLLLVAMGLFATAVMLGKPEQSIETRRASHDVPAQPLPERAAASSDIPRHSSLPLESETPPGAVGRVILDLSMGSFEIVRGEPGRPMSVDAEFDTGSHSLLEEFDPGDGSGWTYRVRFRRSINWVRFMTGADPSENRVRVVLPPDVPMRIEGEIGIGESVLNLGGLWILSADLEVGTGDHRVTFDEPTVVPMERLDLHASIGSLDLRGVGNASPARVAVRHRLGESRVDLRGAWRNDSEIDVRCGIGECSVRLPEGVGVELEESGVTLGEANLDAIGQLPPPEPGSPNLKLSLTATLGELRID